MLRVLASSGKRLALKKRLLENHTLGAVLLPPDRLFHNNNAGVVSCLTMLTARRPRLVDKKTWFAYCRNDGFIIQKTLGHYVPARCWEGIGKQSRAGCRNRKSCPGFSAARRVAVEDEWCAEASIEADYSRMIARSIPSAPQDYVIYKVQREIERHL